MGTRLRIKSSIFCWAESLRSAQNGCGLRIAGIAPALHWSKCPSKMQEDKSGSSILSDEHWIVKVACEQG